MAQSPLAEEHIAQLQTDVQGDVIRSGDPEYDDARAVWNGMIDKYPTLIARCRGSADVIRAVEFARENNLRAAVRGGGHNVAGTALCDEGLVIDLSEMRGVWVDSAKRTAWVQGGAMWGDVDNETQTFGLATPGGVVSKTGVAGLTLGGGIGHLRCKYGLSCDNLRSVDVVTADGRLLTASPDENQELFWGLRGGGGGLGVVTGFEFELHPVGPEVATCFVLYSGVRADELLRAYSEYVSESPDEVTTLSSTGVMPDEDLFSDDVVDDLKVGFLGCYAGPPAEGEEALAPLGNLGDPIADFSATLPYTEFQQILDEDYPDGMRYYWKSLYLDGLTTPAIDRICYWAERAPSPLTTVDVWELGGAITDVDPEESSFAGRHAPFLLGIEANWEDSANDEANIEWVRDCIADMRQFSDGSFYLNFPGFFEGGETALESTFGAAYERLTALKHEYDPEGLFDLNRGPNSTG